MEKLCQMWQISPAYTPFQYETVPHFQPKNCTLVSSKSAQAFSAIQADGDSDSTYVTLNWGELHELAYIMGQYKTKYCMLLAL